MDRSAVNAKLQTQPLSETVRPRIKGTWKGLPQRKHHSTPALLTGRSLGGSLVWLGMTILQRPGKQTSFVNGNSVGQKES